VAFTSDLSGRWGRQWVAWEGFGRFVSQLARWSMRRGGDSDLLARLRWQGQRGEIQVDALDREERFINGLSMQASVAGPRRESTRVELEQVAPGRYRGEFAVPREGRYYVTLSGSGPAAAGAGEAPVQVGPKTFGLAVPYSSEYLDLGVDRGLLRSIAEATGGRLLDLSNASLASIAAPAPEGSAARWRISWPFLLAAMVLLILEVAVRKLELPRARQAAAQGREGPVPAQPEPGYEALREQLARARERHLAALREGTSIAGGDAAARARLYLAGAGKRRP
jgi:hypothetical protein